MSGFMILIAALACPVSMGVMMWMMMRGSRGDRNGPPDERRS